MVQGHMVGSFLENIFLKKNISHWSTEVLIGVLVGIFKTFNNQEFEIIFNRPKKRLVYIQINVLNVSNEINVSIHLGLRIRYDIT